MSPAKKDPILAAAVIKVSLELRGGEARMFQEIYEGVLRDYSLTEDEVERYIEENRDRVVALARGETAGS